MAGEKGLSAKAWIGSDIFPYTEGISTTQLKDMEKHEESQG